MVTRLRSPLPVLLPDNRELMDVWMTTRSKTFDTFTPVEVIRQHEFFGLMMVRTYLDRARRV